MLSDLGPGSLACDILKAAHHGRDSGFYQPAVEAMSPKDRDLLGRREAGHRRDR